MFEIGIISIVVLAVGYWVTLWLMGRRDDVLHGDFVHGEDGAGPSARSDQRLLASRSPFPAKPIIPARPAVTRSSVAQPSVTALSVTESSSARSMPAPAPPAPTSSPVSAPASALSERSDTLQTLLASIKQDLKDASQL